MGDFLRLGPIDSAFVYLEGRPSYMHLMTFGIFDDPGLSIRAVRAHMEACLTELPRYTRRLSAFHLTWARRPGCPTRRSPSRPT